MRAILSILVTGLMLGAIPVAAQQDDPMALQRCIWACLANSPGAASPEYNACVARQCSYIGSPAEPEPDPGAASLWRSGIASDGRTRFAGIDRSGGQPGGLFYMCDRAGQSYLALIGVGSPPGLYRVTVGAVELPVPFDRRRQELTVDVVPGGQLMNVLSGRGWAVIKDPAGKVVGAHSLTGADAALRRTLAACRG